MEREIGEIFEYNGEWYQCVEGKTICSECDLRNIICQRDTNINNPFKGCSGNYRTDKRTVIFKKLEKVGEPFSCNYYGDARLVMMQEYQLFDENVTYCYSMPPMFVTDYKHKRIAIEIKVNKKDMEEKDIKPYDKIFSEGTVSNTENLVTSSLKPFDLEAAKAGKPVCTRDGRKARIICFDKQKDLYPIIALAKDNEGYETIYQYSKKGMSSVCGKPTDNDLMMLPEKKEGWVNVYKERCYESKEEAIRHIAPGTHYIDTIRVEWEE